MGIRNLEPLGVLYGFRGVDGRSCPQVLCFFLLLLPLWQLRPIASRITLFTGEGSMKHFSFLFPSSKLFFSY